MKGFDVARSGDGRVAMIGFPSVGKSSLLNELTETESVAAGYEFTTLTCIPGNVREAFWVGIFRWLGLAVHNFYLWLVWNGEVLLFISADNE